MSVYLVLCRQPKIIYSLSYVVQTCPHCLKLATGTKQQRNFFLSCVFYCQNIYPRSIARKFSYMDKIVRSTKFEYKQETFVDQGLLLTSGTCGSAATYNHGIISLGQNKTRLIHVKSSNLRLKYRLFYSPPLPPPANVSC